MGFVSQSHSLGLRHAHDGIGSGCGVTLYLEGHDIGDHDQCGKLVDNLLGLVKHLEYFEEIEPRHMCGKLADNLLGFVKYLEYFEEIGALDQDMMVLPMHCTNRATDVGVLVD